MGNDDFDNIDNIWTDVETSAHYDMDMHGFPVYQSVKEVENDLKEQQLREQHADLKKAHDDYLVLLEKYGFWDKITK